MNKKYTKDQVKAVVGQVINMLYNNVIKDNGSEDFVCWCEDGDVFYDEHVKDIDSIVEIMSKIATYVDSLSHEIDKAMEE